MVNVLGAVTSTETVGTVLEGDVLEDEDGESDWNSGRITRLGAALISAVVVLTVGVTVGVTSDCVTTFGASLIFRTKLSIAN
jgi:hypothetical protein